MTKCKFCGEDKLVWFQEDGKWVLKKELESGQFSKGNHRCQSRDEIKKNDVKDVEQSHSTSNQKEKK